MRMWMVDPKILCQKHLCGEHVEIHMFLGHLKKGKKIKGFIKNNCLEMRSLFQQHELLSKEMLKRNYKHKSPMCKVDFECVYNYPQIYINWEIDKDKSLKDLIERCPECKKRLDNTKTKC